MPPRRNHHKFCLFEEERGKVYLCWYDQGDTFYPIAIIYNRIDYPFLLCDTHMMGFPSIMKAMVIYLEDDDRRLVYTTYIELDYMNPKNFSLFLYSQHYKQVFHMAVEKSRWFIEYRAGHPYGKFNCIPKLLFWIPYMFLHV